MRDNLRRDDLGKLSDEQESALSELRIGRDCAASVKCRCLAEGDELTFEQADDRLNLQTSAAYFSGLRLADDRGDDGD